MFCFAALILLLLQGFLQAFSSSTVFNFTLSLMDAAWGLGHVVITPIGTLGSEAPRKIFVFFFWDSVVRPRI